MQDDPIFKKLKELQMNIERQLIYMEHDKVNIEALILDCLGKTDSTEFVNFSILADMNNSFLIETISLKLKSGRKAMQFKDFWMNLLERLKNVKK